MITSTALALAGAVLAGALTQRLAGLGFGLVVAPFLMLALGPLQGVAVTNLLSVCVALVAFVAHVREVEYRKALPLLVAAATAIIPGALLARALPPPVVAIGAGVLVVVALAISRVARRLRGIGTWPGLVGAGVLSGFSNAVAGVGGPAVAAYAVASRWPHDRFAITMQFYLAVLNTMSLVGRGVVPQLPPADWIALGLALVLGLVAGRLLSPRIPVRAARAACIAVALLGGIAVILRGIAQLAGS